MALRQVTARLWARSSEMARSPFVARLERPFLHWLLFTRGRCHAAALGWACQCFEECLEDRTPPSPRTPGACIAETISPGHWYDMESPADSADIQFQGHSGLAVGDWPMLLRPNL